MADEKILSNEEQEQVTGGVALADSTPLIGRKPRPAKPRLAKAAAPLARPNVSLADKSMLADELAEDLADDLALADTPSRTRNI